VTILGAFGGALLAALWVSSAGQLSDTTAIPAAFDGVFESVSNETRVAGGLRNIGSPEDLVLRPDAVHQHKALAEHEDPERRCEPVGPFRMMAREGVRLELVPVPTSNTIVMLFEDIARGLHRTISFKLTQATGDEPTWQGYSAGRWEGSTLVVTTTGFNDRTWLNSKGARHSEALQLTERIRPLEGGRYLEWTMTAVDPKVLVKPHSYVRYFQRVADEIKESICEV
jgi:hypothetical protein